MGLTGSSTGMNAACEAIRLEKHSENERIIALAGNPNVGKSTLFNELTGMRQHTGNWTGKTVCVAVGQHHFEGKDYKLVDLPGTYSLLASSAEEEAARDFICFSGADAVIIVCDATCLEKSLNLASQILEITKKAVICLNLTDEAAKKGIETDASALAEKLGAPVIPVCARIGKGLPELMREAEKICAGGENRGIKLPYPPEIKEAAEKIEEKIPYSDNLPLGKNWISLKILENNASLIRSMKENMPALPWDELCEEGKRQKTALKEKGFTYERTTDFLALAPINFAGEAARAAVTYKSRAHDKKDRAADRILMGRRTAIPIMLLLLFFVLWLTISGANYPSELLSSLLFGLQEKLRAALEFISCPAPLTGMLVDGVYHVLAWVVSVMLPPMAIFFPLFTLLEDFGYLPRVAFSLDRFFYRAGACGKQALTTCMGFGCNAAGVVGCRIIDSPRERLIATLTNSFIPCNGRFPTLIAVITMFFAGALGGFGSAVMLLLVILFGFLMSLASSALLSRTLLRGEPSSFTLELPPYRKPQIGKVIVRSVFDRTLFVLGRAAAAAAPAGLIIWLFANIQPGGVSLLTRFADFLDPFARIFGLDGVILIAFILGLPANEIVVPIILMAYLSTGSLAEIGELSSLHIILTQNGWTWVTAACVMLFSLMHSPCTTTIMTIKKETGSLKWTLVSVLLPSAAGFLCCFILANIARIFGI